MSSKNTRNIIIALIILAIGIYFMMHIGLAYIAGAGNGLIAKDVIDSFSSYSTIMIYVIAFIVVILILVYFYQRSGEKATPKVPVQKPVGKSK